MLLFSVEILLYSIFVIYSFSLSPFLYFPRSLYGIWPWYLSIAYISIKLLLLNSEEAWLRTTLLTSQSFFVFFFFYDNLFFDVFCLTSPLLSGLFLSFIFIAFFSFSLFFSYNKMLKNWYIKLINHNHMDHHVNYLISQQSCKIGIIVIPIIQMGNWDTECLSNLPKSTKK